MSLYGKCSCGHQAADHGLTAHGWECTACSRCEVAYGHRGAPKHEYEQCFCRKLDRVWADDGPDVMKVRG